MWTFWLKVTKLGSDENLLKQDFFEYLINDTETVYQRVNNENM